MTELVPPLRAVLIDDTAEIRFLLRWSLEDLGITVVGEAADGRQGVDVVSSLRPDLVVLDVAMPVMDGLQALPLIRAAVPDARIVMLSGFRAETCADAALAGGASAYVEKGEIEDLITTVLRVCSWVPRQRSDSASETLETHRDAR